MLKDQRQKCSGEQHVRQAVGFFFLLLATWHGCGGGKVMEEREKESTVQIFLGLEISIECIK